MIPSKVQDRGDVELRVQRRAKRPREHEVAQCGMRLAALPAQRALLYPQFILRFGVAGEGKRCGAGKVAEPRSDPFGRRIPGEAGAHRRLPRPGEIGHRGGIFVDRPHPLPQLRGVHLEPPRRAESVQIRTHRRRHVHAPCREQDRRFGSAEIGGAALIRDDHRKPARHRFHDRQPPALAAKGVHQAVAAMIQVAELLGRQIVRNVLDLRSARLALQLADEALAGLPTVDGARSEILDDQAHIVRCGECANVGVEQQIDPLPSDRAAHEKEAETLARAEREWLRLRQHDRLHTERHRPHFRLGDAGLDVALPIPTAVHPDRIRAEAHRLIPVPGKGAVLPRLKKDPRSGVRRVQVRRPRVPNANVRINRRTDAQRA